MVSYMTNTKIVAYADDVQFLDSDTPGNIQSMQSRLERTLSLAHKWFVQHRLQINPAKTEMIFIRSVMDSPPGASLCAPLRLPVPCARSAVGSGTWPPPGAIQFGRGKRRDAILKNVRQLSFRQPLPTPLPTPPSLSGCRTKREGRGGVGSWMIT